MITNNSTNNNNMDNNETSTNENDSPSSSPRSVKTPSKITYELLQSATHQKKPRNESIELFLSRLTHLSLENKGIKRIENLEICKKLEVLYLYDNRIQMIENLSFASTSLTHLYLQNNHIHSMKGLSQLTNLVKLYLDGNQISIVEGLENMKSLEELHLSNQKTELQFDPASLNRIMKSLLILDVSHNRINDLKSIAKLFHLRTLNLASNDINSFEEVAILLRGTSHLGTLDLRDNPVCKMRGYRKTVVPVSSSLVELDGKKIVHHEKDFLGMLNGEKPKENVFTFSVDGREIY